MTEQHTDDDLDAANAEYERVTRNEQEMERSLLGIIQREAKASPGPWTLDTDSDDREYSANPPFPYAFEGPLNQTYANAHPDGPVPEGHFCAMDRYRTFIGDISDLSMEDAEFLMHAREDIPRLLAAASALLDLVSLKEGPRSEHYEAEKPKAWQAAREAIDALTPKIDSLPGPEIFAQEVARIRKALTTKETP